VGISEESVHRENVRDRGKKSRKEALVGDFFVSW